MGAELGFSSTDLTLLATAISEVARNITTYAGEGEVALRVLEDGGRAGIEVVASDEGPGIADVELAMQDGYTTGNGLGLGLPGARRLVDEFELRTALGERHQHPARQVDACLTARPRAGPRSSSSASPSGRCRASNARATAPCSPPTTAARSWPRSTASATATTRPTPPMRPRR